MTVVAVRDDGALLVDDGGQTYLVVGDATPMPMAVEQAVARGEWDDPVAGMTVPEGVAQRIAALS